LDVSKLSHRVFYRLVLDELILGHKSQRCFVKQLMNNSETLPFWIYGVPLPKITFS
jgi:hypothetical protein